MCVCVCVCVCVRARVHACVCARACQLPLLLPLQAKSGTLMASVQHAIDLKMAMFYYVEGRFLMTKHSKWLMVG